MENNLNESDDEKYFDTIWGRFSDKKILSYYKFFEVFSKIKKGDHIRIKRNNMSKDIIDWESFIFYKGQAIRAHTLCNILTGVYIDKLENLQNLILRLFKNKGINIIFVGEQEENVKEEIIEETSKAVVENINKSGIEKNILFGYIDLSGLRKDLLKKYQDGFKKLESCMEVSLVVKNPSNPSIKNGDLTMIYIDGIVYSLNSFLDCAIEDRKLRGEMKNDYDILLKILKKFKIKVNTPKKLVLKSDKKISNKKEVKYDNKKLIDGVIDIGWMKDTKVIGKVKKILEELKKNKEIFIYVQGLKNIESLKMIDLNGAIIYATNHKNLKDAKNEGIDVKVFLGCFRKFLRRNGNITNYEKLVYLCGQFGLSASVMKD